MIGIYKILSPSNKIYIGQSVNILNRISKYKNLDCKTQPKLFNSLNKHGWDKHIFEIIEECNEEILDEREIYWIEFYNTVKEGLNILYGGNGGRLPEEVRRKISESKLNHPCFKDPKRGERISQSKINKPLTPEHIKKLQKPKPKGFGIKPEGFGEKLSISKKGIPNYKARKPSNWSNKNKISEANSKPINQYDKNGNLLKTWESQAKAASSLNLNSSDISACCTGRQKTTGGYKFSFKNI